MAIESDPIDPRRSVDSIEYILPLSAILELVMPWFEPLIKLLVLGLYMDTGLEELIPDLVPP